MPVLFSKNTVHSALSFLSPHEGQRLSWALPVGPGGHSLVIVGGTPTSYSMLSIKLVSLGKKKKRLPLWYQSFPPFRLYSP